MNIKLVGRVRSLEHLDEGIARIGLDEVVEVNTKGQRGRTATLHVPSVKCSLQLGAAVYIMLKDHTEQVCDQK